MSSSEVSLLASEKAVLERLIAETPSEDVIDLASLTARLRVVEEALATHKTPVRHPARARVTFRGKPVIGSHGVFAEFGAKAIGGFSDAVRTFAASMSAPLAATGPIPGLDQHQLLITSTAVGSFGFALEEYVPGQQVLDEESPVARALVQSQQLLRGTTGSDEELAESAFSTDRRAIEKLRSFLQVLAENDALCSVAIGDDNFAFADVGQVRRSWERLSQDNLVETEETVHGVLVGILPHARTFELKQHPNGEIMRGKIGPDIRDATSLNAVLNMPSEFRLQVTRVGRGRPRYALLAVGAQEAGQMA